MAPDDANRDPAGFRPEDELDEAFGRANPNPERVGCPPADVLQALARRQRPIADSGYEHLARCSPCYRDFRRFQRAKHRSPIFRWLIAAAALVIAVFAGTVYLGTRRSDVTSPGATAPAQQAVLDLRSYSVTRGPDERVDQPPLRLSRANLEVEVLLPVGSEPGEYELRLLDANLQPRLSRQTTAVMKNFAATIETALDLRSIPAGEYQLAIRRTGEEWGMYPAAIE